MENNLPAFFSSFLILIASFLLYMIGKVKSADNSQSFFWYLLSGLFFFTAVDEMIEIHEYCNSILAHTSIGNFSFVEFSWVILYSICLLIIFIISFKFFVLLPIKTLKLFFLASVVFILGAVILEIIGGSFDKFSLNYKIETTTEEFLETGGMIIFIYTFLDYIYCLNKNIKIRLLN
jgi:hypothetical protein